MPHALESQAALLDLDPALLIPYGHDKAKIRLEASLRPARGRLVLITAMSPSPAGEGKTTMAIGLTDALTLRGCRAAVALREPSMGPVFGMKGGGAGGGQAQLVPAEEINLHFTGDFHAITSAHNLLAAAVDNHLHFGNALRLDPRAPMWERVLDVNDRALREMVIGLGGKLGGQPRQARFDITASSEIMAVLALATSLDDLQQRLARLVVGRTPEGELLRAAQLRAEGSLLALLKDALQPNLVRTSGGSPALVHAGPFGNIAHGTSSVLATQVALSGADLVLQEAGFGADLGAEKFLHLFCPVAQVAPSLAVLVVTLRALRYHAGVPLGSLERPDPEANRRGLANPRRHLENLQSWGLPVVVAINRRPEDQQHEIDEVLAAFASQGVPAVASDVFGQGGAGAAELAELVEHLATTSTPTLRPVVRPEQSLRDKTEAICRQVYRADGAAWSRAASQQLDPLEQQGLANLGVCMAKTPYSFSDDPGRVGVAEGQPISIRELRLAAGAGFVVPVSGDVMTMPGLARHPHLERIHLDATGRPVLF